MTRILVFILLISFKVQAAMDPKLIKLPPNFKASVYAEVPEARSLALSPNEILYVGNRSGNRVYRVLKNGTVETLISGLNSPNGVAILGNDLYIAEISRILVVKNVDQAKAPLKSSVAIPVRLPTDSHHGWKFIRFSPEGFLYVPVGAPCNICDKGSDYAKIFKVDIKTGKKDVVAQGVRNSVGFDFHPVTKELWFTDNGRDYLGDDLPPCELNRVTQVPQHFGFPYCHGKTVMDPEFGKRGKGCDSYTPPVVELRAHVAPLGMRFYTGKQFPDKYRNSIILAEHGSWNRSSPQGYRLTFVQLRGSDVVSVEAFAEGFLQEGKVLGRPVDVEIAKDGGLFVSDDYGGAVYKIEYATPQQGK